ncbi:hypothetical protein [Carboxylicivirga sp. N1Y90]|uniref:hypothetical protein n=1 Tax=Carboxylicivirga fragile TaxID=3417571 RepID=UPI003D34684B|nr:hypothetical protein [Marinilabiliaceae bacterium N1Y90]
MKRLYVYLFVALFSSVVTAQDAHYWTEQFGTKSMLLSNSVVGVVEDLGAVFYNPARLGLVDNPAFVISGKVYELNKVTIHNATGDDPNATKRNNKFGGGPSLVAGTFSVKGWDNHHFAYAFLTRRRMDTNISGGAENYGQLIEVLPGEEYFSGSINTNKKFNEEWMGGTWSYSGNDKFSIGVTGFLNIRDQNASGVTQLQAYNHTDVALYQNRKSYSFKNYGLLFKIGLAAELDPVQIGLTITTPTIGLKGEGTFNYEQYLAGVGSEDAIYVRNNQSGVNCNYKTPFSVAVGVGVELWGGKLMGSGEYFHKINNYTIMQGETFTGQSTGTDITPMLQDKLSSVINFGVGYNYVFNEHISGYLSYSTDYSAAVNSNKNLDDYSMDLQSSTFFSNINHYGGGVVLDFPRADITLGATLASAKYPISQPIDFPDGDGGSIVDPDKYSDVSWNRWRFIVGISVPFVNEAAKRLEDKLTKKLQKKQRDKPKKKDQ